MSCVLVVEDEALIAVETAEVLERHGFAVEIARSGELAVAKLRDGLQADILFTDINLAGAMDGATLARLARDLHPDLIVIYTSGTVLGVAQPVPGSAFVPKPYSPDAVCALLVRARKSGSVVSMPSTTNSSSARLRRMRHSARLLPWTISLPSRES